MHVVFVKKFLNLLVISILLISVVKCNPGRNKSPQTDTAKTSSGVDSMPIVKPPIKDSGSMVITPPTNDSNIVKPDTNNIRK